jgi:hypothetical protein
VEGSGALQGFLRVLTRSDGGGVVFFFCFFFFSREKRLLGRKALGDGPGASGVVSGGIDEDGGLSTDSATGCVEGGQFRTGFLLLLGIRTGQGDDGGFPGGEDGHELGHSAVMIGGGEVVFKGEIGM